MYCLLCVNNLYDFEPIVWSGFKAITMMWYSILFDFRWFVCSYWFCNHSFTVAHQSALLNKMRNIYFRISYLCEHKIWWHFMHINHKNTFLSRRHYIGFILYRINGRINSVEHEQCTTVDWSNDAENVDSTRTQYRQLQCYSNFKLNDNYPIPNQIAVVKLAKLV